MPNGQPVTVPGYLKMEGGLELAMLKGIS